MDIDAPHGFADLMRGGGIRIGRRTITTIGSTATLPSIGRDMTTTSMADIDPGFVEEQLLLMLSERWLQPDGVLAAAPARAIGRGERRS